jgi:hypothetical protein
MTRPEPDAPQAIGLPLRSAIDLAGLSARTTNSPAVGYIAVSTLRLAGERPMPVSASCTTSPCTSAKSSVPDSSRDTFSVLPLVLIGSISMAGSCALIAAMKASP